MYYMNADSLRFTDNRMASRRGSSSNRFEDTVDSTGDAYQIYSEVVNAGKNLQGSKKRVKWLFGFTGNNREQEVILVHSLVTGKKTIYENGIEVVSASNVLAQDFSHGWQSGQRVYRIEAAIGVASEHIYIFSIDGIKFLDFPFKREVNISSPAKTTPTRKSSAVKDGGGSANKYSVSISSSSSPPDVNKNDRGHFQSPEMFDPFESSAEPFDPFDNKLASPAESFTKVTVPPPHKLPTPVAKQRNPSISRSPQTTVQRPEPNLFDDEAPSRPSVAAALFDPFDNAPLPHTNASADLFPQTAPPSFDPFAPTPTHTISTDNFQSSHISNDDLFASYNSNTAQPKRTDSSNILDLFGPTESNAPAHAPAPIAQTNTSSFANRDNSIYFASSFDNFDSAPASAALSSPSDFLFSDAPSATSVDLFSSESTITTTNTAQWNASTLSDLAGLSFDATPSESTKDNAVTFPTEAKPMPAAVEDPWKTSSLVDLDLSGKNKVAIAKKPLITATSLSSMLQDGSFIASPQSSMLAPKSTGLTPPNPFGTGLVPPAPPSFATGTGLAPGFPPSLPGAIQPAFQPPVYGRGLGNTATVASPPNLGHMGAGSPVQAYGTGLGGGFAPSSNQVPGFGVGGPPGPPVMGGMNRPVPGMGLNPGYGGTVPPNDFSMSNNGLGVGLRPPAQAPRPADPRGIMAGGKGNSISIRGNTTTPTITTTSSTSSTNNSNNTTSAGKDILTFNGLGVLPSPTKVNQPAKTSLDSINWRG